VVTINSARKWPGFGLRELFQYRGLLLTFAARDLRVRYRQTVLGVAWILIQPLLVASLFAFVFGQIGKYAQRAGSARYCWPNAGVLGWNRSAASSVRGPIPWSAMLPCSAKECSFPESSCRSPSFCLPWSIFLLCPGRCLRSCLYRSEYAPPARGFSSNLDSGSCVFSPWAWA